MRTFLFICLSLATSVALAGTVGLSPVVQDLKPGQRISTVRITNATGTTAHFQFSVMKWSQKNNKDVDTPTKDIRAFPPIAEIKNGATQIVRVVRMVPFTGTQEQDYRFVVQQLDGGSKMKGSGLQLRYRLEAPVYYRKKDWKPQLSASWDGKLHITNSGKASATIAIDGCKLPVLHILPGSSITGTCKAKPSTFKAGKNTITVQ